jgi:diaminohydroxyphosphoribosylaminopyrimidine deaminase/5-amino-6-(5-phosphoribosylamino)uracil reductase
MARALALAAKGRYTAAPNPMVGAVVVCGGRVTGEGWHRHAGGPHAEVEALGRWSRRRGRATLYVTLEPCVHHGRTPPCVEAILASPVDRVVVAAADPDPRVNGRGLAALRRAGLTVELGVRGDEAAFLNRAFFHHRRHGLPYVVLKSAMTLDGRIADRRGRSRWITSEASRREGKRLREEADAIVVGSRTVLADDPGLDRMTEHPPRPPLLKVLLDPAGEVRPSARLFETGPVLWVVGRGTAIRRLPPNATLMSLPAPRGRFPLDTLLRSLAGMGVQTVLVEGGGATAGGFLRAGLVQEAALFYGMKVLGEGVDGVSGFARPIGGALAFRPFQVRRTGGDLYLRGTVCSPD